MRDLFFGMYGSGLEWSIWCLLFLLIGVILLIVSLVKLKKKAKIAGIIVSLLLIWQIVPVGFYWKAITAAFNISYSDLIATYTSPKTPNINHEKFEKYMKISANTALIPWQKGVIYCQIADDCGAAKQGPKAIEYYNKAYKYIKSYEYRNIWLIAPLAYDISGDIDTAIKITKETKVYSFTSLLYIAQDDLKNAKFYADKYIETSPGSASAYANRAYINYKLNNRDEELADYQKALSLAKTEKQLQYVKEYRQIRNKELARKKLAAKNMGFVKE